MEKGEDKMIISEEKYNKLPVDLKILFTKVYNSSKEEVLSIFPDTKKGSDKPRNRNTIGSFGMPNDQTTEYSDSGSAARFFYCAKASKRDRNEGLADFEEKIRVRQGLAGEKKDTLSSNSHPTVKPTNLMQYLVRLVTPKGGVCLDPFLGSGSTGKACVLEGFDFIGIEKDEEYCKIAEARINFPIEKEQVNVVNKRSLLDY